MFQIEIRDSSGTVLASQAEPGLVSCFEMREFWVEYADGTIALGRTQLQRLIEAEYHIGNDEVT